ncbi:MAG: hypothetical protein HYS09_02520 [Chloroflexi bacterium]|nr:hypothetical protein [Chloroflexota bacterium]
MGITPESSDQTATSTTWPDLSGRWFFAWRMASACEGALREIHLAMAQQRDHSRLQALEEASRLLRREMQRWIQRGEALDLILQRLPEPSQREDE